jgi:hypothetical protein
MHLDCSLKFGCDRSDTKDVLTVGSCSLDRSDRLSYPFGLLSSLSPLLSIYLIYCLILHLILTCIYYLLFHYCLIMHLFISLLLPLLPYIYYSTFIVFLYYLIIVIIISLSLSSLCYIYTLHLLSIITPYHKYHKKHYTFM